MSLTNGGALSLTEAITSVKSTREAPVLWKWFLQHCHQLSGRSADSELVKELDRLVLAAADVGWEIGHDHGTPYLAISPRGESNNEAKKLLASAPVVPGWTIRLYKPPKEWNIRFSVALDGKQVEIDGSQWECVCYRFPDGKRDLVFKAPSSLEGVEEENLWSIALTIVDGELGEEVRRTCVSQVDLTTTWSAREAPMARRLAPGLLRELVVDES